MKPMKMRKRIAIASAIASVIAIAWKWIEEI
jgi:hypothetical protein